MSSAVAYEKGEGDMPFVTIEHSSGSHAKVYLHGATVTSFVNARGTEMLFMSEKAIFDGKSSFRGGIPIVFPQFANQGPLPKHGLVRTRQWECVKVDNVTGYGVFRLDTREVGSLSDEWPYQCCLELRVDIRDNELSTVLEVRNLDTQTFEFEALQHTYFALADVRQTSISGLYGLQYKDKTQNFAEFSESYTATVVDGEVDRIYERLPSDGEVKLTRVGRAPPSKGGSGRYSAHVRAYTEKEQQNGEASREDADIVIWNTWECGARGLSDMRDDEYLRYLCVEPGCVTRKVSLAPTDSCWRLAQHVTFIP